MAAIYAGSVAKGTVPAESNEDDEKKENKWIHPHNAENTLE
jgi:hypothetical protein